MVNELVRLGDMGEKKYSSEQLTKELSVQATAAREMLARQQEEAIKKAITNPSAIALNTTIRETGEDLSRVRKTVKQLFTLYLTNQFVARAVNVRADTLISKGYQIVDGDEAGRDACNELIENSGGINLFWQLSVNTDISGDGFLEKIPNVKRNKILKLKHVHPLTLKFKTAKDSERIIVDENGDPVGYLQKTVDTKNGKEFEKDIPKERISHLRFNTLGDEFTGISAIQPVYNTVVRLMNMEFSAAEAAVKTANPLIVAKTNTRSPHQINLWGQILGRISGQDQVFIPDGMDIKFLSPGTQNFSDYSEYFLDAIVAAFGVPKSILLGNSGGSSNRAEGQILIRQFYSMIRSHQRYMQDFFNAIFEEYAELAGFEAPKLEFPDITQDVGIVSKTVIELFTAGVISLEEARGMIGLKGTIAPAVQDVSQNIKKEMREAQFPETPGSAAGSQDNIKATQKVSDSSEVSPFTK